LNTEHLFDKNDIQGVPMKFPEWFYCVTYKELRDFIEVKTWLCMFQLVPLMI